MTKARLHPSLLEFHGAMGDMAKAQMAASDLDAVKEGIFVMAKSELTTEMTTSLTGGQSMTIPTTQTRTSEIKLISR